METEKDRTLRGDRGDRIQDPAHEITRIGRFISELYDLGLEIDGRDFLVSADLARSLLPQPSPRTGVLAIEDRGEIQLGVYIDPDDRANVCALVEETSHLVCLAWHAARDLPISQLVLELQSEIDRFLYFCHDSGYLSFTCFREGRPADWLDAVESDRYEIARHRAHRYCKQLARRFGPRRDTVGLARELRRFYRASPAMKLVG